MRGDPLKRARTAYLREAIRHGEYHPPPITTAGIVEHHDQVYVVLRNTDTLLAVYKITGNGTLQRLHHWHQALEECVEHSWSR